MGRFALVISWLLLVLPVCALSQEQPSALYLLRRYADTQDKLQSFRIVTETSIEGRSKMPPGTDQEHHTVRHSDLRYDGNRLSIRLDRWFHTDSINEPLTKDSDSYNYTRYLWDGKSGFSYSKDQDNKLGLVIINKHKNAFTIEKITEPVMMGVFLGADERIDKVLQNAERLFVRDRMEKVRGSDCYVIEGHIKHGSYTLWIDPAHGYNISKAEVQKGQGSLFLGKPLGPGASISSHLEVVRYQQIDGVWVPMEADETGGSKWPGGKYSEGTFHYKRTAVIPNPDHEVLGSFVLDEVPNGATALVVGVPAKYTWQDGELIPDIDKEAVDELDKITDKLMAEKHGSDVNGVAADTGKDNLVPDNLTALDLLVRFRATQNKLKSFAAKAETVIEHADSVRKSGGRKRELCEFSFDGERVCHRRFSWDGVFTTREKPAYESFLWDGKALIQYRQGSNATNSSVFITRDKGKKEQMVATRYKGAPLMGICGGDYERVDLILGKASRISLRDRTELVGKSWCYVIDAETQRGNYSVWIDPEHGCNISEIKVQRAKGDMIYEGRPAETGMSFTLRNVRFEEIDDVWVPMEADIEQIRDGQSTSCRHKRTKMILNPDHKTLGSFVADDIPNGTSVVLPGVYGKQYKWHNGKVVTKDGSNVSF